MENVGASLVGVWSMHEAEACDFMDEVYVFAEDRRGACIYYNPVAEDLELFSWTCDAGCLSLEPERSLWIALESGAWKERPPSTPCTVRFTVAWGRDAHVLRLNPTRGLGERYAKARLYERERQALWQHLGLLLPSKFAIPIW